MGTATGNLDPYTAKSIVTNVLGATPKISVEDGGTFDINAKTIQQETPIYIAGAGAGDWPWALATSSGAMASGNYLYDLYLTADATIGAGQFKLGRSNQNSFIYLNGHTLTAKSWMTQRSSIPWRARSTSRPARRSTPTTTSTSRPHTEGRR